MLGRRRERAMKEEEEATEYRGALPRDAQLSWRTGSEDGQVERVKAWTVLSSQDCAWHAECSVSAGRTNQ